MVETMGSDPFLAMGHVALVMSLNKRFDRKVIEGVTRFVRESGRWSVFLEDDPQAKIPDFHHGHFDGVIADLDDPRIPKRLVGLGIPAVGVGKAPAKNGASINSISPTGSRMRHSWRISSFKIPITPQIFPCMLISMLRCGLKHEA